MKTSHIAIGIGGAAAAWYFFFRKVDATSGTVTLTAGKRYRVTGQIPEHPAAVTSVMLTFAGSPAVMQVSPDGTFVAVLDAQQPFAITIGKAINLGDNSIVVNRVQEL